MPLTFSLTHIALTSAITMGVTFLLIFVRRYTNIPLTDVILLSIVVGCSVLFWRSAANTTTLNADPIPGISPNDVLCPIITYVFLGLYAALQRPRDALRFEQVRATLTAVSFLVNVITI